MPDFQLIDPKLIVVNRETRQRQENVADVEDLKQSIAAIGILNPIIVRASDDGSYILVAGERRLIASLAIELTEVPIRLFETLSAEEAEVVELEENIKRKELLWRDQVRAVGRIHTLYKTRNSEWSVERTANSISLTRSHVNKILNVFEAIDSGRISQAQSIEQAYNTLQRFSERKAESIVGDLIVKGAAIFAEGPKLPETFTTVSALLTVDETTLNADEGAESTEGLLETTPTIPSTPPPAPVVTVDPIQCVNFVEWIKTYNGPKFTLIHCDFPYGNYRGGDSQGSLGALETEEFYDNNESIYWTLLDALCGNLDRVMSYSSHLMFWFNMNFYTETVIRLRKTGLMVHDHPLIWHKTGGPGGLGVVPGTAVTYPRRTYDTALLAVRGNRPLAKPGMNSYAAPTVGNKIHPSQKPEPMLRHFLQMLVDETTTVLDPTAGSGAALRAAEDLGARSILGLELDPNYAQSANTRTLQARILRQAGQLRRDDNINL